MSKLKYIVVIILLAALVYYLVPKKQPNIVYLMIDTLRYDHLSSNGYERETSPVIDDFAANNISFKNTVSAAPWTPSSIASMFTGLYPSVHGMMPPNSREEAKKKSSKLHESLLTLADVFKQHGYKTGAVSSNPWIRKHFGFAQGFDEYTYVHRVRAGEVNEEGIKLVENFLKEDAPFFLYLHYMDPHNPYNPPQKYQNMFSGPLKARAYPDKQVRYIGKYDGEIRYLDTALGKLFDYFKDKDLWDDLVIVFVADHGEQFMEHGHQGHGFSVHNEEVHVPFVLKYKDQVKEVHNTVSTVDIYPTLMQIAGIKTTHPLQGFSLISNLANREKTGVISEIKRRKNYKAYVNPTGDKLVFEYEMSQDYLLEDLKSANKVELFDSRKDYMEEKPLVNDNLQSSLTNEFEKLYSISQKLSSNTEVGELQMDESTMDELESLGYLG